MPTKETKKINPLLANASNAKAPAVKAVVEAKEAVTTPVIAPKAPVVKENADASLLSDAKATENTLNNEEKVHFMIPLAEGEKKGSVHECFINGFKYTVKKGVMTQVPLSIASLLAEHYQVGTEAGSDFLIDQDQDKLDALAS